MNQKHPILVQTRLKMMNPFEFLWQFLDSLRSFALGCLVKYKPKESLVVKGVDLHKLVTGLSCTICNGSAHRALEDP